MTTFVKKKLKDKEGNYLVTPSSADIVYCSDGETVATKLRKVENDEFSPTITQVNSMAKVGEGADVDVSANAQEGYVKSAILRGQTLVNTITNVEGQYSWTTVDNITFTHNKDSKGFSFINYNCSLKPNTKYFIRFEYNYTGNENLTLQFGFRTNLGAWDSYGTTLTKGVNKTTLTTKNTSNNLSVFIMSKQTLESASFGKLMIIEYQEGMENWDIPYFEGMQSVRMPVLSAVGKNLFDMNHASYITGLIHGSNQTINQTAITKAYYIPCEPNTSYTISKMMTQYFRICETRVVPTFGCAISNTVINPSKTSLTITTSESAKYLCFNVHNVNADTMNESEVLATLQVEKGLVATSYEPHKSNILSTPEDVTLRGIGDVQDTLDCLTGQVTQRIGEIVFDGSETSWGTSGIQNQTETMVFQINSDSIKTIPHPREGSLPICDKLPSNNTSTNDTEGILVCQGTDGHGFYIRIKHSKLSTQDVNGLKTYLQSNPITIQYVLETPITKTVVLEPSGTNPTTQPYVWKDGHIQLSSEEGSLLPTLDYSVTTSRGGQILENTKHIAKQDKRIYDLEMLMINSSVEDAYQRLLLQNDVQVMFRTGDNERLNPMRYYMLSRLIEENMYEEADMLNKLDTFFLYGEISFDQYLELSNLVLGIGDVVEGEFEEVEENITEEEGVVHEQNIYIINE